MGIEITSIKRKLLIKYPTFGSIIANLKFNASEETTTAGTDGKQVFYNEEFMNELTEQERIFIYAHEICHIAFNHIYRSEGKNIKIWNIATDAVINALLKQDGLVMRSKKVVEIEDAINYDADEMYEKLLKEAQNEDLSDKNEQQDDNQSSHELWEEAVQEKNNEQQNEKETVPGEREMFNRNKQERRRRLQELSKELAEEASHDVRGELNIERIKLDNIGVSVPLIDWRKVLKNAIKYNEEYTRRNARMKNGFFTHKIEEIPVLETEILLDVSGSVSEELLKNFLKECKNILTNSKVKVGCFDTRFYGFTQLKRVEDIDNMSFPVGGGTDFKVAVESFSDRVPNKIIFTDGEAEMPDKIVRGLIWVVWGNEIIKPKCGTVIMVDRQLTNKAKVVEHTR